MRRAILAVALACGICSPTLAQDPTPSMNAQTTYVNGTQQPGAKLINITVTTGSTGTFTATYAGAGCTVAPVLHVTAVASVLTLLGFAQATITAPTTTSVSGSVSIATALGVLALAGAGVTVDIIGTCY